MESSVWPQLYDPGGRVRGFNAESKIPLNRSVLPNRWIERRLELEKSAHHEGKQLMGVGRRRAVRVESGGVVVLRQS